MASGNKKKNQKKGKTIGLHEFLADHSNPGTTYVTKHSWADEVDDEDSTVMPPRNVQPIQLPTAPRAARGVNIDMSRIPTKPPYTAYVGNLPFDVEEQEIADFFRSLSIVNIRIPEGRLRKFGYVEFEDRESLLEALALDDQKMRNNQIRVDPADGPQGGDRDRDRGRGGFDRDDPDEDRTIGDWRKPRDGGDSRDRPSDRFSDRDRGGFDRDRGFGDRDRGFDRDRGSDRYGDRDRGFGDRDRGFGGDRDRGFGGDRDRGFGGDRDRGFGGRDRGFGGDRDRDRGFGSDRDRGYGDRDRGFGDRDRDRDRGYGGFRDDRDGGRRSFGSGFRDDRGGGRYGDRYGGYRDDRSGYRDRYDRMERREEDRGPPASERPRLKLAPRTKPIENKSKEEQASSSIFGGAKPVDTAAREREIEERLKRQREIEAEKLEQEKESRETRLSSSTSERGRHSSQGEDSAPRRERKSSSSSGKGIRTVAPPPGAGSARVRTDSVISDPEDVFDEEKPASKPSPQRENSEIIPAPPPKENAWLKRMEAKPASETKETTSERLNEGPREGERRNSERDTEPKNEERGHASPPEKNAWSKGKPEFVPSDPPKENAWAKRAAKPESERGDRDGFSGSHWGSNKKRDNGPQSDQHHSSGARPVTKEKRDRILPKSVDEMPKYTEKSTKDWSDANKFSTLMADEDNGNESDQ